MLRLVARDSTVDRVSSLACREITARGYAVLKGVVPDILAKDVSLNLEALADDSQEWRATSQWTREYLQGLLVPRVIDLLDLKIVDDCLKGLFLGQARLLSATIREVLPSAPDQHLHRDYPNQWPTTRPSGTLWTLPPMLIMGYYPAGLTVEHGSLRIVPNSQHDNRPINDPETLVDITPTGNDIVLFDAAIIHGSGSNTSAARRMAVFLDYAPAFVRRPEALPTHLAVTDRQKRLLGDWHQR